MQWIGKSGYNISAVAEEITMSLWLSSFINSVIPSSDFNNAFIALYFCEAIFFALL